MKLKGCAHELSHPAVITAQFALGLAVGEMKVFQAGKFDLEFLDLFEGEMRVAGVGFVVVRILLRQRYQIQLIFFFRYFHAIKVTRLFIKISRI